MTRTRHWCTLSGTLRCRFFFFSSRRRHTRFDCDWSSDVCSSDLDDAIVILVISHEQDPHAERVIRHLDADGQQVLLLNLTELPHRATLSIEDRKSVV